jgi:hypothetical protein
MVEITEIGKALGRRVNHDPRSLAFKIQATGTIASAEWKRTAPIFDQGELGSCTGNAAAGVLGTAPFVNTLSDLRFNEDLAVSIYSKGTVVDGYPGDYPPNDTGCDGNSVAKACRDAGYISGWQHITSLSAAHTAILTGPFITGFNWYSGMTQPDSSGLVKISGNVEGGHEVEVVGYDADRGLWKFANSWSTDWGKNGYFFMSDATYSRLLSEDGDATVFVPVTAPAPTPTPAPAPVTSAFPVDIVNAWIKARHYTKREDNAANAIAAWLKNQK